MAREGARIAVNYLRNENGAGETVQVIQKACGESSAFRADVTRIEEVKSLVTQVRKQFRKIDILR